MNKQTEALKMAIEALREANIWVDKPNFEGYGKAIRACREALEQPICSKCEKPTQQGECFYGCRQEQEEVSDAELISYRQGYEQGRFDYEMDLELGKIKHSAPSWQGLSDDEIQDIYEQHPNSPLYKGMAQVNDFARAIEQALKEKNT